MNDARPMLPSAAGEPFGLGARAMRREDLPLVTGAGQFVADTVLPGEVHAVFVRSVPPYQVTLHEVPTATNPLGVKGVGEAGPTAAPPAVINALVDALSPYGVLHVPMPATPPAIWQALQAAKKKPAG